MFPDQGLQDMMFTMLVLLRLELISLVVQQPRLPEMLKNLVEVFIMEIKEEIALLHLLPEPELAVLLTNLPEEERVPEVLRREVIVAGIRVAREEALPDPLVLAEEVVLRDPLLDLLRDPPRQNQDQEVLREDQDRSGFLNNFYIQ